MASTKSVLGKRTNRGYAPVPGARKFLLVLGALLTLLALYLELDSAGTPDFVAVGIGALGLILVGLGVWASDRVVNLAATLFTGWP